MARFYVDALTSYSTDIVAKSARRFGNTWCHLWTDSSDIEELHEFAQEIGLQRTWFQAKDRFPHYDLTPAKRELALQS